MIRIMKKMIYDYKYGNLTSKFIEGKINRTEFFKELYKIRMEYNTKPSLKSIIIFMSLFVLVIIAIITIIFLISTSIINS